MPSRISVEVVGSSSELQDAVARAADALKGLGDVLARQTDMALKAGESTVRANELVAKSYEAAATKAGAASDRTVAAFERQGAVILDGSKAQADAQAKVAEAAAASANEQVAAGQRVIASLDEQSIAALRAADRQVAAVGRVSTESKSKTSELEKFGKTVSLGLLGIAAASVYAAVKFQESTTRLQTQAGASTRQVEQLRKGMLDMAASVGYVPDQLSAGMYHIVSSMNAMLPASHRVSDELHILKVAAEGAQIGGANLEDTAYALASAMNALGSPAKDATHVMGELNAIVGSGDMTMTDLLDSLKTGLIPTAKQSGISLQSMGAALAVLGDEGQRGAIAGTRLRMAIALLSGPSAAASKVLDAIGLSASQATSDQLAMRAALEQAGITTTSLSADLHKPDGLLVAFQDLDTHLRSAGLTATGAAAVMTKAFGGGRTGAGIAELAQQTDRLNLKFIQIGHTTGQFGSDWKKTTETAAFQLHSFEAGVVSLATRIGTDLLPYLDDGVHVLTDVVHWFEQGSAAAHALEIGIGSLATVAIGAYLIGRLQKAIGLMKEFYSFVNNPLSLKVGQTTSSPLGAMTGAGALPGLPAMGVKSGTGPFSLANPGIVAIEAGQYAGLGSMGASGTVGTEAQAKEAAAAERSRLQQEYGAVAPAETTTAAGGVGSAASTAETGAVEAGVLGSLKTGLNSALRGAMVGGIGLLLTQTIKSVVPKSAQGTVGDIGTGASLGAAIGSAIEPGIGTAIGAALGGVGGELAHLIGGGESAGQQAAARVTRTGTGRGDQAFSTVLSKLLDAYSQNKGQANQSQQALAQAIRAGVGAQSGGASASGVGLPWGLTSLQQLQSRLTEFQTKAGQLAQAAGQLVAKQLEAGWSQYKFQSEPIMMQQLKASLEGLPPEAQAAGAQSALQFAQALEQQGKLAPGSVQAMLTGIEDEFPQFTAFLGISGQASVQEFTRAIDLSQTQNQLHEQLDQMRGDFPQVTQAMDETSGDMQAKAAAMILALRSITETGTGPMRAQATQDIAAIQQAATTDFTAMTNLVVSKQAAMTSAVSTGSAQAASTVEQNFGALESNIEQAWQGGVINTSTGLQDIAKGLNASLKALGAKPIPVPAALQWAGWSMKGTTAVGAAGLGHMPGNATGGYIGAPGQRGHDEVLTVLGRGEAVLKHQDQALVNQGLAVARAAGYPVGSIGEVFNANAGKLHYMAGGGYAGGLSQYDHVYPPGVQLPPNVIAAIAQAAGLPGVTFEQISQGESNFEPGAIEPSEGPSKVPGEVGEPVQGWGLWQITTGVGNDAIIARLGGTRAMLNPIVNAQAAKYIYDTQGIGAWHGTRFLINPNLAYTGQSLGTIPGVGGAGAAAAAWASQTAPKVPGSGAIVATVQGALDALSKAANAYGQQQASAQAATAGAGTAGGFAPATITAPKGSKPSAVQAAMMTYADSIVGMPYVYGGGHGAVGVPSGGPPPGFDCSGLVSGVLHAGGFLNAPVTAGLSGGTIMQWGVGGPGKYITVGTRGTSGSNAHMMINFFGKYLESGGGGPLGQSNVHWDSGWDGTFQAFRHPPGYAAGGTVGDFGEVDPNVLLQGAPELKNNPAFVAYAGAHGLTIGSSPTAIQSNLARSTPTIRPPHLVTTPKSKGPKPAKVHMPKIPRPKFGSLKPIKLPPGFNSEAINDLNSKLAETADLDNWYSYLATLYGDPSSAQGVVTVTNADGTTQDVVNWGQPGALPLTDLTGVPLTPGGPATKGIYDWLRDIGTPPNADSNKHQPETFLGVDVRELNDDLTMAADAKAGAAQLAEWISDENALLKLDNAAVAWIEHALDPSFPFAKMTMKGLEQVVTGKVTIGKRPRAEWSYASLDQDSNGPVTESAAKYAEQKVADFKDALSTIAYFTKRKSELSAERSARETQITERFTQDRANLAKLSAGKSFDASQWLRDSENALHNEEAAAKGRISRTMPALWMGTSQGWSAVRGAEIQNISNEYAQRLQALRDEAAKEKFTGQIARIQAQAKLTLEETAERGALTQYFDAQSQAYESDLTSARTRETGDRTYIDSIKSLVDKQITKLNTDISGATTTNSLTGLQAYADPMGTFQTGLDTLKNVTIPTLTQEVGLLTGTTLPPSATTTSASTTASDMLYQQIALQATEALALNEAQTAALASMIPEIPRYDTGGPIIGDQLAMVHDQEYVVPRGGALVMQGGGNSTPAAAPHVHLHIGDNLAPLVGLIRQEIRHPDNVRSISKAIGVRTSQFAGAPGGGRGRF